MKNIYKQIIPDESLLTEEQKEEKQEIEKEIWEKIKLFFNGGKMKKVSDVWTFVYKEKGNNPKAFSYKSHKDVLEVKTMFEENNGTELFDEHGNMIGYFELEWRYLIEGKLIEPTDTEKLEGEIK